LKIINNYQNKNKEMFTTVDIQIGNTTISKYLKEAFNDKK